MLYCSAYLVFVSADACLMECSFSLFVCQNFNLMVFQIKVCQYDGTPLELVTHFKYLGFTLTRDGSMHTAAEKMADNLRLAIVRVYRPVLARVSITHRKHAMLWLFQVFALTAGLYGCQVWATFSLTYDSSVTTRALHTSFILAS